MSDARRYSPRSAATELGVVAKTVDRVTDTASFSQSSIDEILSALSCPIAAQSWDASDAVNNVDWAAPKNSQELLFSAFILREPLVATGLVHYMVTAGVFTANNNNKVALYRYAENGTDYERVAASADDPSIFKTTGFVQTPWSGGGTVTLESGLYFGALLTNWSAVTTAPQILALTTLSGAANPLLAPSNYRSFLYSGQTNALATYTRSAVSGASVRVAWVGVY